MTEAIGKYFSNTTIPSTVVKDIKEVTVPSIFICEKNQLDENVVIEHGYPDRQTLLGFLKGIIDSAEDTVSWAGLYNTSYTELLVKFFSNGWLKLGLPQADSNVTSTIVNGFCRKVDLMTHTFSQAVELNEYDEEFEVFVIDPGTANYYFISTESFHGDKISPQAMIKKYYSIQLEETQWNREVEECMDYGTDNKFETYADCIENEHDKIFRQILGCKVPWLSPPNRSGLCKGGIKISPDNWTIFEQNVDRIVKHLPYMASEKYAACPKSCTHLKISCKETKSTEILFSNDEDYDDYDVSSNTVSVYFENSVRVTTNIMAYGMFDLIVDIGSSLGLWIGLSALGILDLFFESVAAASKKKFPGIG